MPDSPPPLHTTDLTDLGASRASELQMPARGPVFGTHGVVASAQQQASQIGVGVLRDGGNAIDAALAVSAAMVVLQPYSSHLGGDAFVQIRTADRKTTALNAGGRAPIAATPDRYPNRMPLRGATAVAVPGLVDAWCELHARYGSKPLAGLLAPAASVAREGFPVSHALSLTIRGAQNDLGADAGCREVFLSDGPPAPGSTLRQPDLARTIESIGAGGREAFYGGETGKRIAATMAELGGNIAPEDLDRNQAVWGEPLRISYRDWTVYGQPLPSQGYMTLQALKTIEGLELGEGPASAQTVHAAAEAMRLVFRDRRAYAGDPDAVDVPIDWLLSEDHAAELRQQIDARATGPAVASHGGDTTSFAVADVSGTLVTFIQSLYAPWGSGVLVPGTGVIFNNRMRGFSLDPNSPNYLRPGYRTMHTLNTWMLEREDGLAFAGGTPGADFQVQINVQQIMGLIDWRLNAQWAIDAPKWVLLPQGQLGMEARFPNETFDDLSSRGQRIERLAPWTTALCRCQVVGRTREGAVFAASDPRGEGAALGW